MSTRSGTAALARDRVRAATLVAPGRYEIRQYPVPDPAPGCALVRMALSGICGTDKHTYQGYTTQYAGTESAKEIPFPIIQGHENVGTVAAIGPTRAGRPYTDFDGQPLEAQKQTGKILLQQFNVQAPQIIQPGLELLANRDFFTGRPIENQADQELLPFARSDYWRRDGNVNLRTEATWSRKWNEGGRIESTLSLSGNGDRRDRISSYDASAGVRSLDRRYQVEEEE